MSVKLQLRNKGCSKDELGAYCFCRHSGHIEENNVDYPFKETNIYIDMEEVEKSSHDITSGILMTIPINFGVVAVEKKTYHDIHFIHTKFDKIPRRLQCRSDKYRVEKIDDAFSITFPNSNTNCWPVINDTSYTRSKTEKELKFRCSFQPHLSSMVYNDEFLIWADNTPFRFLCRGYSEGPSMCLGQNILNFGAVIVNSERKHVIEVHNYSQSTANFQFDVDNNRSSFQVCPTSGSLLPMSKKILEITFKPEKPQMYYKRMCCLVHQQSSQFIDLMGVCLPNRPDFLFKELQFGICSVDTNFIPLPSLSDDEYFKRNLWGIKFHKDEINFGFHDIYFEDCTPTSRKLTVSSTLPYDVNFEWMEDATGIFRVAPQQHLLEKGGSAQFNVEFSPNFPDSFYNGQMECYIYPKSYNWPNDSGPPWICKGEKVEKMKKAQKRKKHESNHHDKAVRSKKHEHKTHKDKKKHCRKSSTKEDTTHEGVEGRKSKHTPLEISIHRYNDVKGRLILLRARKHFATGNHKSKSETLKKTSTTGSVGDETTDSLLRIDEKEIASVTFNPPYDLHNKYMQSTNIVSMNDDALEKKENLDISDVASVSSKSLKRLKYKEGTDKEMKRKLRRESKISRRLQSIMEIRDKIIQSKRHNKLTKLPQSLMDIAIPLSRSIRVTGHTFGLTNPPHVSQVEMPSRIIMGPTLPKKRVCATTILTNKSDLPACFDVKYLDKKSGYRLKPRIGIIPGNKSQILLTSLNPRYWGTSKYITRSLVNLNLQDNFPVEIVGAAQIPNLTILLCYESATKHRGIVCPITIPGCCTETNMEFINHSRFHFSFHLEPTHPDHPDWQIFTPYPKKGFLSPNERILVRWKFVPLECKTYKVRWRFRFSVVKGGNDSTLSKGSNYEMKMSLTGVGQFCTLQASLKTLDFDILQIFDKETKTFTIQNLGNCGVRAKLAVYHEQWLESFPKSVINISPAKVVLEAGEKMEISVTVRPTRTSLQNFYIEYQLDLPEKDEYEEVLFIAEPVRLIDITFMGDHVNFKVTDLVMISRHPLWSTEHCWNMFSINRMNELLAPFPMHNVPHENTVPKISVVNFRFPPAPVNSEAAIFSLMLSNMSDGLNNNGIGHWEILSESVPEMEPKQFHQQPQPTKRRRSTFSGGDVRDSPEFLQILWNQKQNGGVEKKSYVYTPKHHGTLHWINLRRQSYGHNLLPLPGQQANAPTQNTYFTILPQHGTIKNKSNQQIIFKFSYTEIGSHKMTVLLRVYPGIFVWLELFGRTLALNQGYIQYMYKEIMQLHPVSLSDLDPPVQMFWIYNGGNVPCTYDVDEKPFEEWKLNNFGHAVVQCLNPKGTVPPKAWFPIKIRFSPLEYANYDVPLKIKSENHEDTTVILKGNVSHNTLVDLKLNNNPNESVRNSTIINPLVPVSLSPTRLTINHFIPTGEKFTSVVFITNLSSKHKMSFSWQEFAIEGGGSITFQPNSKLLQPNEEVASMVIVRAGKVSTTFSCMIRCMIEDETANARYEEELEFYMDAQRLWRNKQFNHKRPEPRKFAVDKLPSRPEKPENFSRTLAISLYIGTVFGMLDSLPPEEKSKLPFSDRICPPLTTKPSAFSLLPFGRHLSKDIISNMLWEIVHSSTFEEFAKSVSKRQPPYFKDYKEAESIGTDNEEIEEKLTLSKQTTGEILESTIFNMMQEIAKNCSDQGSIPTTSTDSHKPESGVH